MCCNGKCFKVETGTLIFAIINVVAAALITLASIILLIGFNVLLESTAQENLVRIVQAVFGFMNSVHAVTSAIGNIILGVETLVILVHFTFSILLADGICKKVPSKIKAYFIYGVFVNVCWYLVIIGFWAANGVFKNLVPLLIIQHIYTVILIMIRMTYLKIKNDAAFVYGGHQQKCT